ncbi:hypothetical protein LTR10_017726 [Elasticomyces elasticus]|uniref:Major facilitator superfamily (MFS) profile domain-containing protein n=1 Tax=Exophiala sideris TaxID=1016849 RepID=A0ABR0JBD2_9EURO|nr:hypothetical protein LTR10_017726 [Elasticomyces elasticus]KAK5031023.1 hypothetical protein LTS07_004758 [Exophiala sideris]KAK5038745.1 hypothetical protein LTR13_003776 [Exophiala sideris]KAK5060628.1 hypothetical protein LTR69_005227 [Exophiala sideris]KAK5183541.1 hypothetical protein LTR44_003823 [Eurotiomycetes sp. CCFEE 6388]
MDESAIKAPIDHVESQLEAQTKNDKANEILIQSSHRVVLNPENNARVLKKIDLHVLPIVLGIYLLQALDKATLAYASVFGLVDDAHLHGQQYSWLGSVVYLAQLVAQPLIAYMLVKLPLGKFLGVIVLLWGIALSTMPAAHNFGGLLACRLVLGLFEAGVAPAFIALTQMWWRRREQPVRLGAWYAMNGITNIFGSLLTYGIGHIHSTVLNSYQIIFLFFGLITVVYSFFVYWLLPDSPVSARFLNDEDKLVAIERLRANNQGIEGNQWKWSHVREAALDIKTWLWGAMMFSISVPSGGVSTFGPLIIKAFGFNKFQTILLNMPFGAVQLIATMGGAWAATTMKKKSPVLAFLSLPPIVGCVMLLHLPRTANAKGPLLVAYYLGAVVKVCQTSQALLSPTKIHSLALFVVLIGLYAVQVFYLVTLNKKQGKRREALGKKAVLVDKSMNRVKAGNAGIEDDTEDDGVGQHAFDDKTDLDNEDFIFVY